MRRAADRGPIGSRMRVRSVGSDRHMNRDGNAGVIGSRAADCRPRSWDRRSFASAGPALRRTRASSAVSDGLVHLAAGLFRRAKASIGQHRFHILAGVPGDGDFEIVNGRRAVHSERRSHSRAASGRSAPARVRT